MLSMLDILLLILAVQSASAGPVRRYLNTTSTHPSTDSGLPPIASASSSLTTTPDSAAQVTPTNILDTSSLSSIHTSSTFPATSHRPVGNTNTLSPNATALQRTNNGDGLRSSSLSSSSTGLLGAHRGSPSSALPSGSTSSAAPSGAPTSEVTSTSTITYTLTKTIFPPSQTNATAHAPGSASQPKFSTGGPGRLPFHGTGILTHASASSASLQSSSSSSGPPSQFSQPAPITASFVLGSSTIQVTVSQSLGNAASSSASFNADSTTTIHITRMSTILRTTTTTTPHSSDISPTSELHHGRPHSGPTKETPPTKSTSFPVSTFPTSFVHFTFHPTPSSGSSSSQPATSPTSLPPVVSPSSTPRSSTTPSSASSKAASQQASSSSSTPSTSSSSSSAMAGITIVPVNPNLTTIYATVTETEAGATTTVAKATVTVTVQNSDDSNVHHWRWHGHGGG